MTRLHTARQLGLKPGDKTQRAENALGAGVHAVWLVAAGRRPAVQAVEFDADRFTAEAARDWLARHDFAADRFEAALPPAGVDAAPGPIEIRCGYAGGDAGAAFEVEAQAGGAGDLPRVSMLAYTGVPMKLDGFHLPVVVDLETLKVPRQKVPILRGHDADRIAGHSESIDVSAQRLKAAGVLSGMPQHTEDVRATARHGFPWQVSIGAQTVTRPQHVPAGETAKVNGRVWHGPLLVARNAVLRELSLLPMGADGNTDAGFSASATTDAAAAADTQGG